MRREDVVAVIIGRNEGMRLIACLEAILPQVGAVIYVDSGSTDGSFESAQQQGARAVALDMSRPFNAARARNAGIDHIKTHDITPKYVMFLDGDTTATPDWIDVAHNAIEADPTLGMVTGVLREKYPERSVYNAMADFEWRRSIGEIEVCGGNVMVRYALLQEVGGYDDRLMAGEDEALCLRLRGAGFRLVRLDHVMGYHDAAMERFSQWWRRAVRSGYGFAQMNSVFRGHYRAELRRIALYAVICPMLILLGALSWSFAAFGALLYLASYLKITRALQEAGLPLPVAGHHAVFLVVSKLPNLLGVLRYYRARMFGGSAERLIEYKTPVR